MSSELQEQNAAALKTNGQFYLTCTAFRFSRAYTWGFQSSLFSEISSLFSLISVQVKKNRDPTERSISRGAVTPRLLEFNSVLCHSQVQFSICVLVNILSLKWQTHSAIIDRNVLGFFLLFKLFEIKTKEGIYYLHCLQRWTRLAIKVVREIWPMTQ